MNQIDADLVAVDGVRCSMILFESETHGVSPIQNMLHLNSLLLILTLSFICWYRVLNLTCAPILICQVEKC
jgi:hypothetical protein